MLLTAQRNSKPTKLNEQLAKKRKVGKKGYLPWNKKVFLTVTCEELEEAPHTLLGGKDLKIVVSHYQFDNLTDNTKSELSLIYCKHLSVWVRAYLTWKEAKSLQSAVCLSCFDNFMNICKIAFTVVSECSRHFLMLNGWCGRLKPPFLIYNWHTHNSAGINFYNEYWSKVSSEWWRPSSFMKTVFHIGAAPCPRFVVMMTCRTQTYDCSRKIKYIVALTLVAVVLS